ncbi:hypothetical protein [Paenibacillus sp. RC67]|uniref:hypothetical protein n=1 Tax=Paenibacillus sp. RC67 TaxID=3039392 RepID=UPI0024AD3AE1|nr:hypothetical protein [Paenibacillus sp. RC67]
MKASCLRLDGSGYIGSVGIDRSSAYTAKRLSSTFEQTANGGFQRFRHAEKAEIGRMNAVNGALLIKRVAKQRPSVKKMHVDVASGMQPLEY